ncbi:MAG: DUF3592 domain-containing protein [Oscillospiraceae bacterium]|nr:DUF3592 domain-containing protein [Oscillospiraceae bacterium]
MERYKWSFVSTIIGWVFFAFGVIFLIIPLISIASWAEFKKDAVPVSAEITDIDTYTKRSNHKNRTYHDVYVEYEYDGVTYSEELDYYTSGMKKGDDIEIYVDPDDPSRSRSNPFVFSAIMAVFGLVFGGIGAGFLVHEIKMSIYINKLIAEDKFIYADYSNEEQANVTVNNVRYNHSVFVYDDGLGRIMTFNSEPHHPSSRPHIQGDSIKVYVDLENNPKKYYVSREK